VVSNEHPGADVETAVSALLRGDLAILPTETVYGLGCVAGDALAVARVFEAKGRPKFNPLIAHVTGLEAALAFADLDARARRLAEAFWPGPLTLVAPIRDTTAVCELARAGLDTVAVRAPDHPLAQALLTALGRPVAAPSANRSGRPSPTTHADAVEETGAFAAASLDGGPCRVGLESTVLGQIRGELVLLRPGAVTRESIEAVAGPMAAGLGGGSSSPGRLARHYAPSKPLRLDVSEPSRDAAWLAFGPAPARRPPTFNLSPSGDLAEAAANLFAFLRAADRSEAPTIEAAPIPLTGLGEAINDRLQRAAGRVG
jgi:L-threonylcarbamoyladenylate synthase